MKYHRLAHTDLEVSRLCLERIEAIHRRQPNSYP